MARRPGRTHQGPTRPEVRDRPGERDFRPSGQFQPALRPLRPARPGTERFPL